MASGAGLVNANVDSIPINLPFAGGKQSTNFKDESLHDFSSRTTVMDYSGGNLSIGAQNSITDMIALIVMGVVAFFIVDLLTRRG